MIIFRRRNFTNVELERYWSILKALAYMQLLVSSAMYAEDREATIIHIQNIDPSSPLQSTIKNTDFENIISINEPGEALREVTGVDAGRFGGHGLEPIIQGQQQTQLQVQSDSAFLFGAGPNRMDPPSSAFHMRLFDQVEIDKGYQTVTQGSGGSGGAIRFSRLVPQQDGIRGRVGTYYASNGDIVSGFADVSNREEGSFARASSHYTNAGNYEDGGGDTVRSAYRHHSGIFDLGTVSDDESYIRGTLQYSRADDALFPGAGMDSQLSEIIAPRIDALIYSSEGALKFVELLTYASLATHSMDNFSLRKTSSPMLMKADTNADIYGARANMHFEFHSYSAETGIDLQYGNRRASRYTGMMANNINRLSSVLWPDIDQFQGGLFAEITRPYSTARKLTGGVRIDRVRTGASAASSSYATMMPIGEMMPAMGTMMDGAGQSSANTLYERYYGRNFGAEVEYNPSAFLRYEHALSDKWFGTLGLSYVTRTADATERGIASESMLGNWVGNPGLDPERHHQLHTSVRYKESALTIEGLAFINLVQDFILRDRARGQSGILQNDGATIYRNVDSTLTGFDLLARYELSDQFQLLSDLSFTWGENRSDHAVLAQIPPLNGKTAIEYSADTSLTGVRLRYAARQSRVDDNLITGSGRDAGETPGYAVVDAYYRKELLDGLSLKLGVSNIFNVNYFNHLNRENLFDPIEVRIFEPGRSFTVGIEGVF